VLKLAPGTEIGILRTPQELESLAGEWEQLAARTDPPTLGHAWALACAGSICQPDQLHVVAVRSRGSLTAVAPLARERRHGVRRLALMGSSRLGEPSGLLYADQQALTALARAIVGLRMPVMLARIPAAGAVVTELRAAARGRGVIVSRPVSGTVGVPITSSWERYLARLSSRRRYDLRRARRRAEQTGKVTVRITAPGPGQVAELYAELVRIESTGWKQRAGSSLLQRRDLREFFQRYAGLMARTGRAYFSFLEVDSTPIAAQLSVESSHRLWILKIGYDEGWSHCSPGWQLLAETMRFAFERGFRSYEFFGSDERWLHGWITEPRSLSSIAFYPARGSGCLALAADGIGWLGSRFRR
jgi:CelD/BcsL family acetyltransferase involved in cellulose biosynthesis